MAAVRGRGSGHGGTHAEPYRPQGGVWHFPWEKREPPVRDKLAGPGAALQVPPWLLQYRSLGHFPRTHLLDHSWPRKLTELPVLPALGQVKRELRRLTRKQPRCWGRSLLGPHLQARNASWRLGCWLQPPVRPALTLSPLWLELG